MSNFAYVAVNRTSSVVEGAVAADYRGAGATVSEWIQDGYIIERLEMALARSALGRTLEEARAELSMAPAPA